MSHPSHWQQDHKLRVAILLYHALQARAAPMPMASLHGFSQLISCLRRTLRLWEEAQSREWHFAASQLQPQVANQLYQLQRECQNLHPFFNARQKLEISPIRLIKQDLKELEREFDQFELSCRPWTISCVTSEPVELEGVALGRFRMTLNVSELIRRGTQYRLFSIEALDPSPAASSSEVVHPHVRDGELCLGDALHPLKMALSQGRLFDAFTLVDRTLHTYNPHSAYVSLEEWNYARCEDCGGDVSPDDLSICHECNSSSCLDCSDRCSGCEEVFCQRCIIRDRNGEPYCPNCRGTCRNCEQITSQSELDEHDELCADCHAEQEAAEAEDLKSDTEPAGNEQVA